MTAPTSSWRSSRCWRTSGCRSITARSGHEALRALLRRRVRGDPARREHAAARRLRDRQPDPRAAQHREDADHLPDRAERARGRDGARLLAGGGRLHPPPRPARGAASEGLGVRRPLPEARAGSRAGGARGGCARSASTRSAWPKPPTGSTSRRGATASSRWRRTCWRSPTSTAACSSSTRAGSAPSASRTTSCLRARSSTSCTRTTARRCSTSCAISWRARPPRASRTATATPTAPTAGCPGPRPRSGRRASSTCSRATSPSASSPRSSASSWCASRRRGRPPSARTRSRTSSWRRSRTSCARRSRRSWAGRRCCAASQLGAGRGRTRARGDRAQRAPAGAADRRPARRLAHRERQAPDGGDAGRPARVVEKRRSTPCAPRRTGAASTWRWTWGPGRCSVLGGSRAAAAGGLEPGRQRREVQRARAARCRCASRRTEQKARLTRAATTASASARTSCPTCSSASSRRARAARARTAASAWGSPSCSHIVQAHGGSVAAESGGIGKGATFTVVLPRVIEVELPEPAATAEPAGAVAGGDALLRGRRLLVVDDEADVRDVLCARAGLPRRARHDGRVGGGGARALRPRSAPTWS